MSANETQFEVRLARSDAEIEAAQRLRYRVFIEELGGDGPLVDHVQRLEKDQFDPFYEHLLLLDHQHPDHPEPQVVGVYRLLNSANAAAAGRFYTADEYDLSALTSSGRNLVELGRSCLDKAYRGGSSMFHMWNGLAEYVLSRGIEIMFGVASFHGTDPAKLAQPLAYLHQNHLAPADLRVRCHDGNFQRMDLLPDDQIDRRAAMKETPALIKAYLRLGGYVGEGAFIDRAFNTTDVCLIMDTQKMNDKYRVFYEKRGKG